MLKISNIQENLSNNIESETIIMVEDKLNIFFDLCIEKSLAYTVMLSENGCHHSKDNFEKMVLSSVEIDDLITYIVLDINNKFHQNILLLNFNNNIELNPVLTTSIKEYKRSLKITTYCEDIINKTISKGLNLKYSNRVMSHIIKGENIGALILGNNNYLSLKVKYKKEIFNQIQGILLNTKCGIRNQLINYIITTLRIDDLEGESRFLITG